MNEKPIQDEFMANKHDALVVTKLLFSMGMDQGSQQTEKNPSATIEETRKAEKTPPEFE